MGFLKPSCLKLFLAVLVYILLAIVLLGFFIATMYGGVPDGVILFSFIFSIALAYLLSSALVAIINFLKPSTANTEELSPQQKETTSVTAKKLDVYLFFVCSFFIATLLYFSESAVCTNLNGLLIVIPVVLTLVLLSLAFLTRKRNKSFIVSAIILILPMLYLFLPKQIDDSSYRRIGWSSIYVPVHNGGEDFSITSYKAIKGSNPLSFRVVHHSYATEGGTSFISWAIDKDDVYLGTEPVQDADPDTFTFFNEHHSKDKNNIYYDGQIIPNADIKTFECLGWRWAKDKNNIYFGTNIVNSVDLETFEVIDEYYSKDKNNFYHKENVSEAPKLLDGVKTNSTPASTRQKETIDLDEFKSSIDAQNKIKRSQKDSEKDNFDAAIEATPNDPETKDIFGELDHDGVRIRYPTGKQLRDCRENDWVHPEYIQNNPDFCKTNGDGLIVLGLKSNRNYEKYFSGNISDISMSPYFSSGFGFERKIKSLKDKNNNFAGWIYFGSIHQDVPGSIDLQVVKKQGDFLVYYNQRLFDFENSEWSNYFGKKWDESGRNYDKLLDGFLFLNQKLFDDYYARFVQIYSY